MKYVSVESFDNYIDANLRLAHLQQEHINCWLKDEYTVTIDPVLTNAIGGIKLMVHEAQAERARSLLRQWKNEAQQQHCPGCGSTDVQLVSSARKPGNWFMAIITFLLGSYAIAPEKKLHCFTCGREYAPASETGENATKNSGNAEFP